MNLAPLQASTPTDTTAVLARSFNAPRHLVWEAFCNPAKMRRWMLPPPGWTLEALECDVRVKGVLKLAWKNAEGAQVMTIQGIFTEVVAPERSVHTETMSLASGQVVGSQVEMYEFIEEGSSTTLRITQTYPSKEARDEAISGGMMCEGMEAQYKLLDAMLAQVA